jgi:CRP-like cAMP-binding protein
MRRLLQTGAIPFATAEYDRRMAIFHQGDTSDDILYIEDGDVLLAVSTRVQKATESWPKRPGGTRRSSAS